MTRAGVVAVALVLAGPSLAQDPAALAPGIVAAKNEHVRALHVRYAPGEGLAMHEHPARVVVFLTDAKLQVKRADGPVQILERKAGQVEAAPPTKHSVKNVGASPFEAIEIELLQRTLTPPLGDALAQDPAHTTLVLENEWARVLRTRVPPGDTAPMHGHGERVTVILSGDRMRTRVEGGSDTESEVARGDVSLRMPTRHEATNVGKVLHDAITVELKPRLP